MCQAMLLVEWTVTGIEPLDYKAITILTELIGHFPFLIRELSGRDCNLSLPNKFPCPEHYLASLLRFFLYIFCVVNFYILTN